MTGLVGAGGGSRRARFGQLTWLFLSFTGCLMLGFLIFAALCRVGLGALSLVKTRWRNTRGAMAAWAVIVNKGGGGGGGGRA